ncbi:MAG: peptide/nickel transport system permease protein [Gaiellales bacterium]|nr:peptide/nickel transport system permease protein [Gaiellales bacterium]
MLAYILKRLAMTALVVLVVMTFLASLVHLIPGDPVKTILGPRADPELSKIVRHDMQLDLSVPRQIWNFVTGAVQGDHGVDFVSDEKVTRLVFNALPHTVVLAVASLLLAMLVGVPLGVYAATRPNTWMDRISGVLAVSCITIPSYVAGLFLVLLFAVQFRVLPAIGTGDFSHPLDYLRHLVLPAIALGITWIGYFARLVRASMLEVMNTNYIRTAQAFGLHERAIFYRYALRNAIIPTIAVLGVGLGNLMGYAIFVEVIFARPGLGTLIYDSIESRNYPIVRGGVLVVAILFVLANLLADLSYRVLDPRIRVEQGR